MFTKVILASDLSEASERVLQSLDELLGAGLKEVVLTHVIHIRDAGTLAFSIREHAERALQEQAARLAAKDLKVRVEVPIGIPHFEINELAQRERADLVVVGSHGKSALRAVLLGSTAERIIHHATVPVLLVRLDIVEEEKRVVCGLSCCHFLRRVLYPTDFSANARKIVPLLKELKGTGNEYLCVLHVQEPKRIEPHLMHRLAEFNRIDRERLEAIKEELVAAGLPEVETRLEWGEATTSILKVADEADACLIALGHRGRGLGEEMFMGSTAHNVVRHSRRPVLVVP